jgi:DEAD/DEAH box helicase domain-containing protein
VAVTDTVLAYQRKRVADHAQIDLVALDLPETSFSTQALWFELDSGELADTIPLESLLGALHATEHAQIAVLPLIAMCDRWDIGGLSTNLHPQTAVRRSSSTTGTPAASASRALRSRASRSSAATPTA